MKHKTLYLLFTLCFFRAISFAQETLCERLQQNTSQGIDLSTNTNSLVASPTSPSIKSVKNALVIVTNIVTITDRKVEFEGCDIRMMEDAGFIVPQETNLTFKNCRIAAFDCHKLWQSIDVQGGSLVMQGNEVEDAKIVINSSTTGNITAKNNTFNRNYLGVNLKRTKLNSIARKSIYNFRENNFTQNGSPISPNAGSTSIIGMKIQGVIGIRIYSNYFSDLNNAIQLINSNLTINGGGFYNIKFDNNTTIHDRKEFISNPFYSGVGIFIDNSSCNITSTNLGSCDFSGIAIKKGTIYCENSGFKDNKQFDIIAPLMSGTDRFKIINNTFSKENQSNIKSFIDIESTTPTPGLQNNDEIVGNSFYLMNNNTNENYSCIFYNGHGVNNCNISGSFGGIFPLASAPSIQTAILSYGGNIHKVSNNGIEISRNVNNNKSVKTEGIRLAAGNQNTSVEINRVIGELDASIHLINAKGTNLCSNELSNGNEGLWLEGDCSSTLVQKNSFSNNQEHSLFFEGNGLGVREQKQHGNIFLINHGKAEHTGTDYKLSEFRISPWPLEQLPKMVIPSDWFQFGYHIIFDCKIAFFNSDGPDMDISPLDEAVLNNELEVLGYTEAQIWNANYNLYSRLINKQGLPNEFNEYITALNSTNIAKFYHIEQKINDAVANNNYVQQLDRMANINDSLLLIVYNRLAQCFEQENDEPSSIAYEQALLEYSAAQESLESFLQSYMNTRRTKLIEIENINASISASSVIEQNLKKINTLRIKYLNQDAISSTEWEQALQIARICTKNGGMPTNLARVLVAKKSNDIPLNCENVQGRMLNATLNEQRLECLFYPNPVSNKLNINYKTISENAAQVRIVELSGKIAIDKPLNSNENVHTIDVSSLKAGFYIINIYDNGKLIAYEKMVKSN